MITSVISIMKKKGTVALAIVMTGRPETPDPTNKLTPSGGVINPIAKFTIIIIPK